MLLLVAGTVPALAGTVQVFEEPGFPTVDTAAITSTALRGLLPSASFVGARGLTAALDSDATSLLVLPYGSAFPENAWAGIRSYLDRGGNLLVLGGRPFTRGAYQDAGVWKLRDYSVRFTSELMIDQYDVTPASSGLEFKTNPDAVTQLPAFAWQQGFSPTLHLSDSRLSERGGSAGRIDSRIDALAWGVKKGRRLAAPVVEIDHIRAKFTGGRWIFVTADLLADFASSSGAQEIVTKLAAAAERGTEDFHVDSLMPLYTAGEPVELEVSWISAHPLEGVVQVTVTPEDAPAQRATVREKFVDGLIITMPAPRSKGLHRVNATLLDGSGKTVAIAHSGFWMRDEAYLTSGPKLSVNQDYFELNGKPLEVVGTTYMSSDVQRLYYAHPNVYVWDSDLAQIAGAGLNMLRTGWWSGWEQICDENGKPSERTLRTLEAYLMTARKYNLPVQFNVFAFLPDVLGGTNAYLDPVALQREKTLYSALARRFGTVPFLAWDLINEPSFSQYLWSSRPNGDAIELAQWNAWLQAKYPSRSAMAAAWNVAPMAEHGVLPVPLYTRGAEGPPPTSLCDFYLFSQDKFAGWVAQIRATMHAAGSQQLITVGQDEGGNSQRLLPAYFGDAVDFTANHSWRQNDNLLWNSLIAKQPGKAMLIQEMGAGAGTGPDGISRRDPESQAALFERKVMLSFAQASGAIEWLWNTNGDMVENGEVALGGVRADKTEKPETEVLRGLAAFASKASPHLLEPEQPQVAIVTSQAAQFSAFQDEQTQAQQRAVQALCYGARVTGYVIAENQIGKLGHPKLVILPSPQALGEPAWQALLTYVRGGGNLLITGPVNRDSHWQSIDRLAGAGVQGRVEPLTYRVATIEGEAGPISMTFDQSMQGSLEGLRFADGKQLEQQMLGGGRIFWSAFPVELADEPEAASKLYTAVLQGVQLQPSFEYEASLPRGVLVFPTVMRDAVMYLFDSASADDTPIDIKDKLSGGRITFLLPAQHAAAVLLDKRSGAIIAKYGY